VIHSRKIAEFLREFIVKVKLLAALLVASSAAFAQAGHRAAESIFLTAPTTLPIAFTKTVSAKGSHPGDSFTAKTTQVVQLASGEVIPGGAKVIGHVVAATPFVYDTTPYARQKASVLSIHFDSIEVDGEAVPLSVMVRAMADPITSEEARTPINHDIDASGATTQIGGDQRYPWNAPVTNEDGDVVAYSRHGGVYAHLIASAGCGGSSVEVSVGIYSASACGLYGFDRTSAEEMGSFSHPSTVTLVSTHGSPKIWNGSTALLEVLPQQQTVASR
jgi:hypothetical protein